MATYSAQCSAVGEFGYANYFKLYVELTETEVSIENNTSKIKYNVYCQSSGSGSISARHLKYFSLNGADIINTTESVNVSSPNAYIAIASGTTGAITHNNDGSKTVAFSAQIKASSYGVSASVSGTFTLSTIARASTPSCITYPNTTQNIGNLGDTIYIHTNRASSSFTHTITYAFGNQSGTIGTGITNNVSWIIPKNLANAIPNATSGTGTITAKTYNGSTLIGSKSISFTVSIPNTSDFNPSISSVALSEAVSGLADQFGCYVQNKSKLSGTVTASGVYSSTIKSYKITINGATYTSKTFTTGVLTKSGSNSYSATVTDSRGRTASTSGTFTVVAYSSPKISTFSVTRCNSGGTENEAGEYAKVVLGGNISSVNSKNTYSYSLKYKKSTDTSYTTYSMTNNAYSISKTITDIVADVDSSYDFLLTIGDYFSTVSKTISLETAFVLLNWKANGRGMAVGKVAEEDNLFDVNFNARFRGKILGALVQDGSTTDDRKLSIDTGNYNINTSSYSGWANGLRFRNNTGDTGLGYIGAYGPDNALEYYFIGSGYNSDAFRVYPDGKIYTRSGTHRIYAGITLFDNSSGTSGGVTLNETAENFKFLEIFFGRPSSASTDNQNASVKIYAPNGKTVSLSLNHPTNAGPLNIYGDSITISGANITRNFSRMATVNSSGFSSFVSAAPLYIYCVVGFR